MPEAQRRSPYLGLIPYDEQDAPFFFGREKETRIITANLFASRLTLLYGASGVGKSSVLQAGVVHQLRPRKDVLAVVFSAWQNDPLRKLKTAVADASRAIGESDPPPNSSSLAEYLAEYSARLNARLFIILDQFEEYFLYHAQQDSQGAFDVEFPRAVNRPGLRVNFLISIRQDALAELDRRFKGRITNLFNNRLEVKHLSREAARLAIENPIDQFNLLLAPEEKPVGFEKELVEEVLEQVKTGQVMIGEGGRGVVKRSVVKTDAAEPRIETPYLQLVMTRLWEEEMRAGSLTLRLETLKHLGGAKRIVRTHLDAVMSTLPSDEQEIAARIFRDLVTPSGTKIAHIAPDLAEMANVDQAHLTTLVEKLSHWDTRILRTVAPPLDRPDTPRYEIFHDVLAPAILDWRSRYVQAQELTEAKRRAASEAAAREKETARQRELEQAQSLALEQQRRAEAERQRAEEQKHRADTEHLLKEEQKQRAEAERQRAEENARAARNGLRFSIALGVLLVVTITFAVLFRDESKKARASAQEAVDARSMAVEANRLYDLVLPIFDELSYSGDPKQSLDRLDKALKKYRDNHDTKGEGIILATIGDFDQYLGRYSDAQRSYEEALPILKQALGVEHPYVAKILDSLGTTYSNLGNYARAEELEVQALDILKKRLGPEHTGVATALNNLALIYFNQGKYDQAESLYNRALDIGMKVRGPDDVEVAQDRNNLALLYNKRRKYAEAQSQFEQALDIWKKNLGEENTTVADGLNNLAEVYRKQGKYSEAEPLARQALAIREKNASGPDDPDLAPNLNILGMIYTDEGKYGAAEPLFKRALAIREKALGPDHEKLAISLNGLAVLYYRQGKYTEAEQQFKRALAIREKALGPDHPDVAETLEDYAALLSDTGRKAEAAIMKARARNIRDNHMN